jgi:uncharacterized protein involved in exopolysaccharide biosynthesis
MGELPEQRDTNLRGVEQLNTKLEINMDALDKAETRKLLLQREIADLRTAAQNRVAPALPSGPSAPSRVDQLRTELAELRARYTDRHPDVIRAQEELARLEKLERETPPAIEVSDATPLPSVPVDPALRAQLDATEMEIRSLHAERERILADTSGLQGRVANTPRVEQELLSLTRDYDNIHRSYESLLDKRINARLAENLEKSRQSEQFTVLERAVPPSYPYGPNKLLFLAMGLAGGCLLGAVAALLRERIDSTYTDADELLRDFPGVQVLATIPVFSGSGSTGAFPGLNRARAKRRS